MSTPSVLICGASIAGPAAASCLAAAGWRVTVVERADHLREEGQNIDVRGTGREVLRRMGLEDAVRAAHTGETGTAFVDGEGGVLATFGAGTDDSSGPTAELEVLRGRLSRVLHDHGADAVEYVFGDRVVALDDDGEGVDVTFTHARRRRFDAVVVAEGARSRTRELVLPGARIDELGLLSAYLTVPRTAEDDTTWRIFIAGRGRTAHLRPDDLGTARAMLTLYSDVHGLDRLDRGAIATVLRATFGDLGWEVPRILAALDDAPLYVDAVAQVRLPTWSRGRVALLGDAAWCAGPFGTGTTSALTGAYVLAGELATTPDDVAGAFARYETTVRPLVDRAQQLPPGTPGAMHPRSERQRRLVRTALRVAGGPVGTALGKLGGLLPAPAVDTIALPRYEVALRAV